MPDHAPTILDIDGFSFRHFTSAISGIPTAPARPPACHDPMSQVEGFADATLGVEVAVRRLLSLKEDLQAIKLALVGVEEAKRDLQRSAGPWRQDPTKGSGQAGSSAAGTPRAGRHRGRCDQGLRKATWKPPATIGAGFYELRRRT